jgi:non-heme chloroperoxidase
VARHVAKYGQPQGRVAKAVLAAAVPPLTLKTEKTRAALRPRCSTVGGRRWLRTGRNFYSIFLRVRFTAPTDPERKYRRELSRIGGVRG